MGRNSDFKGRMENFRRRLYRSANGKLLGVFTGIAESLGCSVCWTRIVGVGILLGIAGSAGANGFGVTAMVCGFFYMLLALLMQPPRAAGTSQPEKDDLNDLMPPSLSRRWERQTDPVMPAPRVDLAQLDRQLDSLDRRIQRMETIVTDRQYDWERRLDS